MKFATIGHLIDSKSVDQFPNDWNHEKLIFSPEFEIFNTKGHFTALKTTAKEMMMLPQDEVRKKILDAALFLQDEFGANLVQLGALTTSVTSGGKWLADQEEYTGFVNHGDSYTAAITCIAVEKALEKVNKDPSELELSIVGAYGVIGEAVSKILVPKFSNSCLIGRRIEKLKDLEEKLDSNFETTTDLEKTKNADIIVTATNHPSALLNSKHLKKDAIVIDVSQPPNLSKEICDKRPDVTRVDGGYVTFKTPFSIPAVPKNKIFSCVAEIIMQAMENEHKNHVGSIDLKHLEKTVEWGKKYNFTLDELTNFGKIIRW